MARAFIASVALALVLVAAVVVPVAVTPGSFGFNQWPEPSQSLVSEAPLVVQVADDPAAGAPVRVTGSGAPSSRRLADASPAPSVERRRAHPHQPPRETQPDRPAANAVAQVPAPDEASLQPAAPQPAGEPPELPAPITHPAKQAGKGERLDRRAKIRPGR